MKNCWLLIKKLILFLLVIVTSCSSPAPKEISSDMLDNYRYGNVYMQQMNYAINDKLRQEKEAELRKEGVQIIAVGQEYKLIIPAYLLFYTNSPRIQWNSYAMLNKIVYYMQDFSKVDVKVVGFTIARGNPEIERALSINRARNVANYLWEQETGAGILYIQGYVTREQQDGIEISFRSIIR